MSAVDLDPRFGLPLWAALVRYLRRYPPLVQANQQLELPLTRRVRRVRAGAVPRDFGSKVTP